MDVLRIRTVPILLGEGRAIAPPAANGTMLLRDKIDRETSGHTAMQYSVQR